MTVEKLSELLKQQEALNKEIERLRKEAKKEAIASIRKTVVEFQLTENDLRSILLSSAPAAPRYPGDEINSPIYDTSLPKSARYYDPITRKHWGGYTNPPQFFIDNKHMLTEWMLPTTSGRKVHTPIALKLMGITDNANSSPTIVDKTKLEDSLQQIETLYKNANYDLCVQRFKELNEDLQDLVLTRLDGKIEEFIVDHL